MAYTANWPNFLNTIKSSPKTKLLLSKLKLPSESFFGDPGFKTGKNVTINASAKTSRDNIVFLAKKLGITQSGPNLDFSYDGITIRFIESGKTGPGKINAGSRNALGRALADAGELATVASLKKDIVTAKDTGQQIFIKNTDAFIAWQSTFKHTKPAVLSIVGGSLSGFHILHDATDTSSFKGVVDAFCMKIKKSKDSWNPADIFIIKSVKREAIINELDGIVANYTVSSKLVEVFNNKLYEFYKKKLLYPISLKQLVGEPKIEYTNEPGKVESAQYKITINNFNVNLSAEGKEIGLFTFKNNDTNKTISLQVRGFPHGYGISQTEITSDGTPTGGRLGKISTSVVDAILEEYEYERIKSISFFGRAPNVFGEFGEARMLEVYSWYTDIIKHPNVSDQHPVSFAKFKSLINSAKNEFALASNLCHKIQGLKIMHFFVMNNKHISVIMNKCINGAKKISTDNGFFIKIS